MSKSLRNMLVLSPVEALTKEERWLRQGYENIVANLVFRSISTNERFDPIASKYYGIHSIQKDTAQYKALLEITSYFWASRGGRGALLEKVIADTAGKHAANNVPLEVIPAMITAKNFNSDSINQNEWTVSEHKRLKFDLVNIIGNDLVILELKNRVDSGGTAAREEALTKKFFAMCNLAEGGTKIFNHTGKKYSLTQMLSSLGIKTLKMYVGLLYGIDGKDADLDSDKKGFGSRSKNLLRDYCQKHHDMDFHLDEAKLGLSFETDGIAVSIETIYGNDVTRRFMQREDAPISLIMNKIFTNPWDDVWFALKIAISELSLLRNSGNSNLMQIGKLFCSDKEFASRLSTFTSQSRNSAVVNSIVALTKKKIGVNIDKGDVGDQHLLDFLYAYASYYKNKGKIKKSIIRTEDEEELV